jgi:hypothetical protein
MSKVVIFCRDLVALFMLGAVLTLATNANADSVCDLALKSGAFNTTDYSKTSRVMLKKRDDACKAEYSSQAEAASSGQQSGGSLGYGAFSLSASDAKQSSSGKYSIADSKFCKASAEELDSFTSVSAKQQIADIALTEWNKCISSVETSKLYVVYSVNPDGSGMTGTIVRRIAGKEGFGTITGIAVANPKASASLNCKIGQKSVGIDQAVDIPFEKGDTVLACSKDPAISISISLVTSQGDQEWIPLPSASDIKRASLEGTDEAVSALRRQVSTLASTVARLSQENGELRRSADTSIGALSSRVSQVDGRVTQAAARAERSNVYFAQQGGTCPAGTRRRGTIGVIMQDSDYVAGNLGEGGAHVATGWHWTHPVLCTQ